MLRAQVHSSHSGANGRGVSLSAEDNYDKNGKKGSLFPVVRNWVVCLCLGFCCIWAVLDSRQRSKVNEYAHTIEELLLGHEESSFSSSQIPGKENDAGALESHPIQFDYTAAEKIPLDVELSNGVPTLDGSYPKMRPLGEILRSWDQNNIDNPPMPFLEELASFDYQVESEMATALEYRKAELPFKVHNIKTLTDTSQRWTDKFLRKQFSTQSSGGLFRGAAPKRHYLVETSILENNFFIWYDPRAVQNERILKKFNFRKPQLDTGWDFDEWLDHARSADAHSISHESPHYYLQTGIPAKKRKELLDGKGADKNYPFITEGLPFFRSGQDNFFVFNFDENKGIQCRFGERGVTAATHYDSGRNSIAMIKGAKRYILSPPRGCEKLSIETDKKHPSFRHSLLNFAQIKGCSDEKYVQGEDGMEEKLALAATAPTVETILSEGEILYIPSYWFHYIISLQTSVQCNSRSGQPDEDKYDTSLFGGKFAIEKCLFGPDSRKRETGETPHDTQHSRSHLH